jgi:hypothetical protein
MALGGRTPTPDLPGHQVWIDYFSDPHGLVWHQLLLLQATAALGVWMCATPDHEVDCVGLNRHRVIALDRASTFPEESLDFGLPGQRVMLELVVAVAASGTEWMSHLDFVHKTGLSPTSGFCRSHRRISEALLETAVARNPVPDFQDLDANIGSTINEFGGIALPEYNKFIATAQPADAFTLTQRRFGREEQYVDFGRRSRGGGDGGKGDGSSGRGDGPTDNGKGRCGRGRGGRNGRDAPAAARVAG